MPVTAAVVLLAAAAALQSPGRDPSSAPGVVGVAIRVPAPQPAGAPVAAIRATYRVVTAPSGTRAVVLAVTGPHLGPVTVREHPAGRLVRDRLVTVSGVADCRSPSALEAGTARYPVVVRSTGLDGTTARTEVRLPTSPVDWAGALRQDCWQRVAATGVRIERVTVRSRSTRRELLLDVRLTNALARDVEVGAVDIADVSTIEPADSGVLPAGGARVVRVRLPLPDCVLDAPPGDSGLLWSVGDVGGEVAATFATVLPPAARAAVLAAVHDRCAPPGTTVRVTGSRLVPPDTVVRDRRGAALALRLSVSSGRPLVELGTAPGPGLTADGRLPTTVARVRPVDGSVRAVVVWHASCAAEPPGPLRLPVRLPGEGGADEVYSVTVDGPGVARTYARACGLPRDALVAAGWRPWRTRPVTGARSER